MDSPKEIDVKTWVAFISMVFGMFMAVLDIQIVASSLNQLQAGLFASRDEINWIQSSYLIAEVIIIPISGWLTKAFSTRIIFAVSCAGFTITSLACAMAWDLNSMIIFRALQGLFGGSMIPVAFSVVFTIFPRKMQSTVIVIIGLVVTVAPISGPIIGGYITDYLSWHYLFLLNLVPGVLVTVLVLKLVDFDQPDYSLLKRIDFLGIILIALSLGTFQYVLEEGNSLEWFNSKLIIFLSIIAFVSFVMLIFQELRVENPIIELRSLSNFNFSFSCIFSFVIGWGLYTSVFIMPMFLGYIKGLTSIQIGEYLCVMGFFQLLSAPCAGFLSKKIDLRIILFVGLIMFGLGLLMNSYITHDSGFKDFFLPQALRGFALMFCFLPITSLAYATLTKKQIKSASGLYNLMRNLGGAVGLAVASNYLSSFTQKNYAALSANIESTNDLLNQRLYTLKENFELFNYYDPEQSALQYIDSVIQREAYVISFNQVNIYISLLFFISAISVIFIKKAKPEEES